MRIALGIEYDGSDFSGWQYQSHSPSVQDCLEQALSKVADQPVRVMCAGRTDTGVHALGQVVHFDTEVQRDLRAWTLGANANLPKQVVVLWAQHVDDDFHARFSAHRRRYRYVIFNRPIRPTFLANRVAWEFRPLDVQRMQRASQHLLGEHDFSAYRAAGCQSKTPMREVTALQVQRKDDLVLIDIEANAFLHHMVRNIAGVLMTIGAGEQPVDWSHTVLISKDRCSAGTTAPAAGLYFVEVDYRPAYDLPRRGVTQMVW